MKAQPTQVLETAPSSFGDSLRPALLAAVLAEVMLLRLVLRLGQALPSDERLGQAFRAIALLGVLAQNFAVLLGMVLLGDLAVRWVRLGGIRQRAAGLLVLAAGACTAALTLGVTNPVLVVATGVLSFGAMAATLLVAPLAQQPTGRRQWLALALVAYALLYYHYVAQAVTRLGWSFPWPAEAYFAAEGAAVVAGLGVFLLLRPRRVRVTRALAASLLPAILLAGLWVRPWTVASLSVWTFGFTLFLPAPVYALGLWSYLYTVSALAQGTPAERRLALGLGFIALAGLKLDYSYFNLLALVGVSFLAPAAGARMQPHAVPAGPTRPVEPTGDRVSLAAREG